MGAAVHEPAAIRSRTLSRARWLPSLLTLAVLAFGFLLWVDEADAQLADKTRLAAIAGPLGLITGLAPAGRRAGCLSRGLARWFVQPTGHRWRLRRRIFGRWPVRPGVWPRPGWGTRRRSINPRSVVSDCAPAVVRSPNLGMVARRQSGRRSRLIATAIGRRLRPRP